MGNSNTPKAKTIAALYILLFFSIPPISFAEQIPTAEDINKPAEEAKLAIGTFMRESIVLRMGLEYSGKFLWQVDKEKLYQLAKNASEQLQSIAESQKKAKKQIEDYQGDDWDEKYGSTGLWRKLFSELYTTDLNRCEIDFYAALCAEQAERDGALREILARIESLSQIHDTAYLQLLKARTLARLARTDSAYKPSAKKEFDGLLERSDMRHSTVFKIEIERIKFLGPTGPNQLTKLAENIANSNSADDIELILFLACLQRRLGRREAFEKTVLARPKIENILGQLALSDMSCHFERGQLDLQKISLFEAELAARAAWRNNPQKYKTLLKNFADRENFRTPLILYVTAAATAEESPTKAVNLLLEASKLPPARQGGRPDIEAAEIAEQAALLAYNLLARDNSYCRLALEAFANYSVKAGENIDEELEYLYSTVLINCGQSEKGRALLQKIAGRTTGHRQKRARLDLIEQEIKQKQNEPLSKGLLAELNAFLKQCTDESTDSKELRRRAITIYCGALLKTREKHNARRVLDTLTETEIENDPNLNFFKSKALRQMGRLGESAESLAMLCRTNDGRYVLEAEQLLRQIIGRIEELQRQTSDPAKLMKNSQAIARYCLKISQSTYGLVPVSRARLYLAEILLLDESRDRQNLLQIEKLLGEMPANSKERDVDFLRCRARLLSEQGKYKEAAALWTQVAKTRKSQAPPTNRQTWQWWRAKFYELDCYLRTPQTSKESVLHAIEVIESSYTDIPALWAEKLNLLKEKCR